MELARAAMNEWSLRRRWKNAVIVVAVRVALGIARPMPRAALVVFGRVLGVLAWIFAGHARATARSNVERVFGNSSRSRRKNGQIVRRCFVEMGALLGDAVTLLRPTTRALDALPLLPDAKRTLDDALTHGRGVVLVTAHLGAWERMASALVESGYALTTPVRESYDPRLQALVHDPLRRGRGVVALDRDAPGTSRALLRALRAGGIAGFLVDVNTRVAVVHVPFLGHEAPTPSAPARLALRTGAPVVVAIAAANGIRVEQLRGVEPARTGDIEREVVALTARMNEAIGAAILEAPERWIWMHRRWPTEA